MQPGAPRADPLRARSLAEIDRLLTASADRFGVARIAEITRLDRLGIPAVSVTRRDPIGESVSVCTGKGDSLLEARVAGLAEALERYCAEPRGRLAIVTCPARELDGDVLAPARLIPRPDADLDGPIDWCRGARLDRSPIWLPVNAVAFPYLPSATAHRLFAAHTHGLAAGGDRDEAIVHGLLECTERDAYARAVALASTGRGAQVPVIDPAPDAAAAELLARIRSAGLRVLLRDLTADHAVPVVLCVISDGNLAHMGIAAHLDPDRALRAAALEAAQSRVTDLQGAREDLPPRDGTVDPWFVERGDAPIIQWPTAAPSATSAAASTVPTSPPSASTAPTSPPSASTAPASPPSAAGALSAALATLVARLAALDPPIAPVYVDLSLAEVDIAVVRVVAPDLETWAHDPSRIGPRARKWLTLP
jgi:YcaO-like protein with predicted kinase domain